MGALLNEQKQLEIFTSETEAELYHSTARHGFFSILSDTRDSGKRQRSYKLQEMPRVLSLLDKNRDSWISQAEFTRPNRRVVNLWRVGLLFVDIDTYHMAQLRDKSPEYLVQALLGFCADIGIPPPSITVFSGRGLQAKWLLDEALPRAALPRWNRAQAELVGRLEALGADVNAKDASRVLRLVQTTNTKNGEMCRVVHVTEENGRPIEYRFDTLCEYLLPYSREQLSAMRAERAKTKSLFVLNSGNRNTANISGLRGFSGRQLAWHRLEDLRRLSELRGGYREGERMLHLFWQLNFLLLSGATNSRQMYHEAKALAHAIDNSWHSDQSALATLYSKAKQYEAGEQVEFNGKRYPALYTPRNDTLINLFEITDDEQRQLKTIITKGMARERHAERDTVRRRAAGAVNREAYLGQTQQRRQQAIKLRSQGMSYRLIAHELGVSAASVHNYLK